MNRKLQRLENIAASLQLPARVETVPVNPSRSWFLRRTPCSFVPSRIFQLHVRDYSGIVIRRRRCGLKYLHESFRRLHFRKGHGCEDADLIIWIPQCHSQRRQASWINRKSFQPPHRPPPRIGILRPQGRGKHFDAFGARLVSQIRTIAEEVDRVTVKLWVGRITQSNQPGKRVRAADDERHHVRQHKDHSVAAVSLRCRHEPTRLE